MTEESRIVLAIALLVLVYLFTRKVNLWRSKRALAKILKDLRKEHAFEPSSAIPLSYARVKWYGMGVKDFRPKAVQFLVESGIVEMTPDGRYYLKDRGIDVTADPPSLL